MNPAPASPSVPSRRVTPRRALAPAGRSVGWGLAMALACPGACSSGGARDRLEVAGQPQRPAEAQPAARPSTPAAMVDGVPVSWDELRRPLAELAGAAALTDLVLDRRLPQELSRRGLALPEEAVNRERALLEESIRAEGDPAQAQRLADDLRRARGLGPERFDAFLRRNAMLRALVAGGVEVTEEMVRQRYEVRHGRRLRVRVLTVPTHAQAAAIRERLSGADHPSVRFAEAAFVESTDESAARGGLIESISPADPSYESVVRQTLAALPPGQLSPVVALEQGYALFLVESELPPSGVSLASARGAIEQELRRRQERVLMDALARTLLEQAGVTVFDPSLAWSWSAR